MKHSFVPSQIDKSICKVCSCSYMNAHSPLAVCESCNERKELEFFPDTIHPKKMLLCPTCIQKELSCAVTKSEIDIKENGQNRVEQMLAIAHERDEAIRYNGDFFNAKVLSLESIRSEINSDNSLSADEKAFKFQSYLAERIAHLKKVVFELDEQKYQAVTEELVIRKSLREIEKDIKEEIRAKIKETDSKYEPVQIKQVKPKVKKEATSTFDKLIQAFMMLHNCDKETAIEKIKQGSGGKLGNEKLVNDKIPF